MSTDSIMKASAEGRARLSNSGYAPLYHRLAEVLIGKIEKAEYRKGQAIPGEKQIASEYGVSLITVRAAMRILIDRGLVARYPGKGSFVLSRRQIQAFWGLGSVDDLLMTGKQSKLVLLKKALIQPPDWVAHKYGIPLDGKAYWFRTVRVNRRVRFLVTDIYLPIHIGSVINQLNFESPRVRNKVVVSLVEEHLSLKLGSINQTMGAELASADIARSLGIKSGTPVLVIDRDYISTKGELIQIARSRYRVDRFRYTINVAKVGAGRMGVEGST